MTKQTLIIIIVSLLALSGGILSQRLSPNNTPAQLTARINFSLPDLTGKQRHINEWRGKVLVINFWATWCPPCLKEIPSFIALQDQFADQDLQFIGIAIEDKASVEHYLKTITVNYPMLIGGDAAIRLSHQLGNIINAVPFSIIVDKKGHIIHRQPGELSPEEIISITKPLL